MKLLRKLLILFIIVMLNVVLMSVDSFTYDYFEMIKMRDEFSVIEKVVEFEVVM